MSEPSARTLATITIDGPSGSGKGTISARLALRLGFHLLDSGAVYRVLGLAARSRGLDLDQEQPLAALARGLNLEFVPTLDAEEPLAIQLDGQDVTRRLRTDAAGVDASRVARFGAVRDALRDLQRGFRRPPGLVADGRDMGTEVFPDAELKVYLTASAEERARRRYKQLIDKDIDVNLHDLLDSIRARDEQDMTRAVSPLRPAVDALILDSSALGIEEVLEFVLGEARRRGIEAG